MAAEDRSCPARDLSPSPTPDLEVRAAPASIAKEVAKLLTPTINEVLDKAVTQGIQQLRQEVLAQAQRLTAMEHRISAIEHELPYVQASQQKQDKCNQPVLKRIEDLENRSRRNSLRIIGLPESYAVTTLNDLCSHKIPQTLSLREQCVIERAQRIGSPNADRVTPRPVIVRYLNYVNKALLLQTYRQC